MKFTCQQSDFSQALNIVSKAISVNNTLPVLNNIFIKLEENKAVFIATNLEIAITVRIPVVVHHEGGTTVPAKLMTSYVNLLASGDVDVFQEEGEMIVIKAGTSQSKIKGLAPEEFPLIPQIEKKGTFSISSKILLEMINKTTFAASTNLARPILSGVYFDLKTDKFVMVATDSYRLSEVSFSLIDNLEHSQNCIIPVRTVAELGKILIKYEDSIVNVTFAKNQVLFSVDEIELTSRLIEGTFPDYERIIPISKKTTAIIKREDFISAVKKVNLFVPDNNCVKIEVKGDCLKLFTDETQVGEGESDVYITLEGEENTIALNSQYLLDILLVLDSENVFFEMTDNISPIIIRTEKDSTFIHIIMPLKV